MDEKIRYSPGIGKKAGIIGAPLGFGAGTAGSELGVSAMRLAKFRGKRFPEHLLEMGYEVADHGDVEIVLPERQSRAGENPKFIDEVSQSCAAIAGSVRALLASGEIPIILGGDHSIAAGSLSGISKYFRDQEEEIGLIWFDAHADMNTAESSPSGNTHGMPLSALLGEGDPKLVGLEGFSPKFDPKYLAHIGARDLDRGEKEMIRAKGLRDNFFTMSDIDRFGMKKCVEDSIAIASKAPGGFAVTFDVDVIDPRFAPGSGTLVRGGLTYREAHLALEMVHESGGMRSFEIVEVNPILDKRNITAILACELILSAFGNVVL